MSPTSTPKLERCSRVLVVEGYGDLLFYAELLEWVGIAGVYIKEMGGKQNLTNKALETFLSEKLLAEKAAVGVIVDADSDAAGTARSLTGWLTKITRQAVEVGAWTPGPPRVGLHVAPGGTTEGEIETLVWRAWAGDPRNAPARGCVEQFLACMASGGHAAKSPDKGRIGALLAVLYDEDPRLGPGARSGVFDFSRPEYAPLIEFLRGL